jgi:hypothetical protein
VSESHFAKPVLYEVPTYLAGCPIGTLNRKTKRKKAMAKELKNICMTGLFSKIEPTLQNMNSIAEFNKIIKNYLKMKQIENGTRIRQTKLGK